VCIALACDILYRVHVIAILLFYPYRALGGVGSTSQSSIVQDGGKSRHAEQSASNVQGAGSSRSMVRTFTRCNWVEVASA